MRADLGWSLAQAGAMNTANAIGYLAGAIAAGPLVTRAGCRRTYTLALAVTALALLSSAATSDFAALLALRLTAGVSGAVVFIAGAALVTRLVADLPERHAASLLAVYFAGGGLGILFSAVAVPPVVGLGAGTSWRWGWVILGTAALAALLAAAPIALRCTEPAVPPGRRVLGWPVRRLTPAMISYGLFGAGYIAYVTFIVAFLRTRGLSTAMVGAFWAVLGSAAVLAAFAWGPVLSRLRGGKGPALVLSIVTTGALLPLVVPGAPGDFASAVLFGGAFLAVVTAVIDLARRALDAWHVPSAIAVLTAVFSLGQSLGPVLAGVLSDGPSGLRAGLGLGAGLLAAATVVAMAQPQATPGGRGRAADAGGRFERGPR